MSYKRGGKRLLDLLLCVPALVALSPLLVVVAVLVRRFLGTPVLFRQPRLGKDGREFILYKFRTMTDATDSEGRPLPESRRITRLGRFLRSSSLDELPELFNILRGEMSLVGPRPLLVRYRDRYSPEQWRRHEVRPGLTGWAQVNGRNLITWEEKFRLDVWYVDHLNLALDLKILWMTVRKVIVREGISPEGADVPEEFMGSRPSPNGGQPR
ncbi:MAG: sugar transferase [Candidatus Eremiobacterota bacterium]